MRSLLVAALLLVLATGCEDDPVPVATEPVVADFCAEIGSAEDLVGVEAPADLTAAEAEGFRLLTEPGLAPPDEPQEQQAVTAFAAYVEETCPDLDDTVLSLDTPSPSTSPTPTRAAPDNGPFCTRWVAMTNESLGAGGLDLGRQVKAFQEWLVEVEADQLDAELPADARAGLDVFDSLLSPLDPEAVTQRQMSRLEAQATPAEQAAIEAFGAWVDGNCGF